MSSVRFEFGGMSLEIEPDGREGDLAAVVRLRKVGPEGKDATARIMFPRSQARSLGHVLVELADHRAGLLAEVNQMQREGLDMMRQRIERLQAERRDLSEFAKGLAARDVAGSDAAFDAFISLFERVSAV